MSAGPLEGVAVVVTRAMPPGGRWCRAFADAGADAMACPILAVCPPEDPSPLGAALGRLDDFDWIVLASQNALGAVAGALTAADEKGPRIATVGPATTAAARERGLTVAFESAAGHAAALARELGRGIAPGAAVLLPQAADGRPELADGLRAAGFDVTRVDAYRTEVAHDAGRRLADLLAVRPHAWIIVTSPRIAEVVTAVLDTGSTAMAPRMVAIGPTTARALDALGRPAVEVARRPTPQAAIEAIVAGAANR